MGGAEGGGSGSALSGPRCTRRRWRGGAAAPAHFAGCCWKRGPPLPSPLSCPPLPRPPPGAAGRGRGHRLLPGAGHAAGLPGGAGAAGRRLVPPRHAGLALRRRARGDCGGRGWVLLVLRWDGCCAGGNTGGCCRRHAWMGDRTVGRSRPDACMGRWQPHAAPHTAPAGAACLCACAQHAHTLPALDLHRAWRRSAPPAVGGWEQRAPMVFDVKRKRWRLQIWVRPRCARLLPGLRVQSLRCSVFSFSRLPAQPGRLTCQPAAACSGGGSAVPLARQRRRRPPSALLQATAAPPSASRPARMASRTSRTTSTPPTTAPPTPR